MKKAIVVLAVFLMLVGTMLPSVAWAGGRWRGGHHGGHGIFWLPGAIIGGLALGAVAIVTAPILALSAAATYAAPPTYPPSPTYAPPPTYSTPPMYPPAMYSAPPTYSSQPPYGTPQTYSPPPTYAAAPPIYQQAPTYAPFQAPSVQRVIVYPNGRYVLYGDGVYHPWQWVWMPAASPPPPSAPPQQ